MTIPLTVKRGLGSIRTNSDRTGIRVHKAYLRVGSLEMEKERRLTERRALMTRVAQIDARCRELDAEKNLLLNLAGETPEGEPLQVTGNKDKSISFSSAASTDPIAGSSDKGKKKTNGTSLPPAQIKSKPQRQKQERAFLKTSNGLNFKY